MTEAVMIKGKPDSQRKSCYDCIHCKALVSWWCVNANAINHWGSSIPGKLGCPYWEPVKMYKELKWWDKAFGDYIDIEQE